MNLKLLQKQICNIWRTKHVNDAFRKNWSRTYCKSEKQLHWLDIKGCRLMGVSNPEVVNTELTAVFKKRSLLHSSALESKANIKHRFQNEQTMI